MVDEKLLTVEEFAKKSGTSKTTLYKAIKSNQLKTVIRYERLRKKKFIPESEMERFKFREVEE